MLGWAYLISLFFYSCSHSPKGFPKCFLSDSRNTGWVLCSSEFPGDSRAALRGQGLSICLSLKQHHCIILSLITPHTHFTDQGSEENLEVYCQRGMVHICFPFAFYCCDKYCDLTETSGRSLFGLHFYIMLCHWRKPGQELESGTEAETNEELCLLPYSLWFTKLAFLNNPGPPGQEWQCPQWTLTRNQENLHRCIYSQVNLIEAILCWDSLISRDSFPCLGLLSSWQKLASIPVTPELRRRWQGDHEFKTGLNRIDRSRVQTEARGWCFPWAAFCDLADGSKCNIREPSFAQPHRAQPTTHI